MLSYSSPCTPAVMHRRGPGWLPFTITTGNPNSPRPAPAATGTIPRADVPDAHAMLPITTSPAMRRLLVTADLRRPCGNGANVGDAAGFPCRSSPAADVEGCSVVYSAGWNSFRIVGQFGGGNESPSALRGQPGTPSPGAWSGCKRCFERSNCLSSLVTTPAERRCWGNWAGTQVFRQAPSIGC